ncbi:zinc ribbon domain-containing protein [Weissella ceti]|uniref:zinc ribbon domain-containing protein n=1 Tax=Weissella ceti TaxID=759620 RepID=UPI001BCDC34E|nr:hypothetical protein KHQ31_00200 [Weissella ceti]
MFKSKQYCQSCGFILTRENAGTNADLSHSHLYCQVCFQRGRYTQPYITYRDMVKKCYSRLNVKDMPWWKRYGYLVGYPMFLRTLARWRSRVVS